MTVGNVKGWSIHVISCGNRMWLCISILFVVYFNFHIGLFGKDETLLVCFFFYFIFFWRRWTQRPCHVTEGPPIKSLSLFVTCIIFHFRGLPLRLNLQGFAVSKPRKVLLLLFASFPKHGIVSGYEALVPKAPLWTMLGRPNVSAA